MLLRRRAQSDSPFSPKTQAAIASSIAIPPPPEAQSAFTRGVEIATKKKNFNHTNYATTHWKKAATLGHVDATHALGVQALKQQRMALAFEFFLKAANAGHTDSCFQVGRLYLDGDGVERDAERGIEFLERAADKQYAKANRVLGRFYASDADLKDEQKAIEQFKAAIDHGDYGAHAELGNLYHDMNQPELALQQYRLGVKRGDCHAMFHLGMCYVNGCCVTPDPKRAGELLVAAGDQNSFQANYDLAERFEKGDGVPRDRNAAVTFYQFAWEAAVDDSSDLHGIHMTETALLRLQAPFDPASGMVKNCMFRWIHHVAGL